MPYLILRVVALFAAVLLPLAAVPIRVDAAVVPTMVGVGGGFGHSCAVTSAGRVKCWGENDHGQLGNGSPTDSLTPVNVTGIASSVASIAVGFFHSCARTLGGVKCWGSNDYGQLGNGTTSDASRPVDVVGLSGGVRAIAAGIAHTCALTSGGGVKCWGYNGAGQLGNAGTTDSLIPVEVAGLSGGVTAIAAGFAQTCAITLVGGVMCWGGFGGNTPIEVAGLTSGIRAITIGEQHLCALTDAGGVKCLGSNQFGQLGDGTAKSTSTPVDVAGLTSGVTSLTAGGIHTCAVTGAGGVKCWGYNVYGRLGDGTATMSTVPVDVSGLASRVSAVSGGLAHTCAITIDGGVSCWGWNFNGQLGNGKRSNSRVPVHVDFVTYQTIALSASRSAGRIAPGTVVTFSATVAPLGSAGERATVRFEIYRRDGGVWRRTAHRDVTTDGTGRATLRWTFVTTGARYVRAMALATAAYAASPWSSKFDFTVR